jgi:hypothetical protein
MMTRSLLLRLSAALALAATPLAAQAQSPVLLDFESFNGIPSQGCGGNGISAYGGLNWSSIGWASRAECGQADPPDGPFNGYYVGTTSGTRAGYLQLATGADPFAAVSGTIASSGKHFNLLDGWLTAAWSKRLRVVVTGYRGPTIVGTQTLWLDYTQPTFVRFAMLDLTSVRFDADGGTPDWALGGIGNQVVMDDLRIEDATAVPEPATLLLVAPGLAAVALVRRRRR